MPLDVDYLFGKKAVGLGHLNQEQLEECIEVQVALERAGSHKRLWDIITRKGYMTSEDIAKVREETEPRSAKDAEEGKTPPQETRDDETVETLAVPAREAGSFSLAHISGAGKASLYPLPMRMVILGKDPECDIVLPEPGVVERHVRVTCGYGKFRVSRLVPSGRLYVNGGRMIACNLGRNDLIELGSALVLFMADYEGEPAPQPTSPADVEGPPNARLRITDGPEKGASFFLGSRPLVIGSHILANVRLSDSAVSKFHAHISATKNGIRLVDLKSRSSIKINGLSATDQILKDGDNISIGASSFSLKILMPSDLAEAGAGAAEAEALPKEAPAPVAEVAAGEATAPIEAGKEEPDWDVSLDVEVDIPSDPMMRAGLKPMTEGARPRPAPKAYAPGELQLTCVEGPLEGKVFVLKKKTTLIGRDRGAEIRIDDVSVSRRHAEIVLGPRFVLLRDLSSRNGVFVNGGRVSRKPLRSGDTIRIGKCLLIAEEVLSSSRARK